MKLICLNRKTIPGATRHYFFIDELSATDCYVSTTYEPERADAMKLDPRRSAFLMHDKMTVPVAGDGRVCVGPGDMLAASQACIRAGVRVLVDLLAVDVMEAVYLCKMRREG